MYLNIIIEAQQLIYACPFKPQSGVILIAPNAIRGKIGRFFNNYNVVEFSNPIVLSRFCAATP